MRSLGLAAALLGWSALSAAAAAPYAGIADVRGGAGNDSAFARPEAPDYAGIADVRGGAGNDSAFARPEAPDYAGRGDVRGGAGDDSASASPRAPEDVEAPEHAGGFVRPEARGDAGAPADFDGAFRVPRGVLSSTLVPGPGGVVRHVKAGSAEHRRLQISLPPIKIVITNAAPIIETWRVFEAEFIIGQCLDGKKVPGAPVSAAYSSGTRPENPEDIPELATDGSIYSPYTAQCFRGCKPYEAFVGLDLTGMPEWLLAQKPNHTFEEVRVRCVRFYQSADYRYFSQKVAVQEVYYWMPDLIHSTLEVYDDAAGDIWSRRPAYKNTVWRIVNLSPTPANWSVSEVKFYEDTECSLELGIRSNPYGRQTSSTSFFPGDEHGPHVLFDGNVDSYWVAACISPQPNTTGLGCAMREAFVGMDFGDEPVVVRCIRIFQTPQPEGALDSTRTHTYAIALQRWGGAKYEEIERFWDIVWRYQAIWPEDEPTLASPFFGHGSEPYYFGSWEDTRGPDGSAVKLSNDDYTAAAWNIIELEFYEAIDCSGFSLSGRGMPISMQGPRYMEFAWRAFDGEVAPEHLWSTNCTRFRFSANKSDACDRQEGWIGSYFRPEEHKLLPNVRCFRLLQSRTQLYQAASVNLWTWKGGEFAFHSNHRDLGGGWWNRRPAQPYSMWRAINLVTIGAQWRIQELRAYKDELCLNETESGMPIAAGFLYYRDDYKYAFDGAGVTSWGADCEVCDEEKRYWIGMQLPYGAEDIKLGRDLVKCIKIWQSPTEEQQMPVIRIDLWTGGDWVASPITEDGSLGVVGGGAWLRRPALPLTLWRLTPMRSVNETLWTLKDVEFYGDPDCTQKLRMPGLVGGVSVALSGYKSEALVGLEDVVAWQAAADGNENTSFTMWHRPAKGRRAWFALDFLSEPSFVRCVRFRQGELEPRIQDAVRLEVWDGNDFTGDPDMSPQEIALEGLGGGGWQRRPAKPGTLWRIENAEFVPEGWILYEVEFHTDAICGGGAAWTGMGEFFGPEAAISSGYVPSGTAPVDKYGPQKAFDKDPTTVWKAQCGKVPESMRPKGVPFPPLGCQPRSAWVGLDIGIRPQEVRCVRILQTGYRDHQSESVALSKWDGFAWVETMRLDGLGGSAWDRRPAAANTMWRMVHKKRSAARCDGAKARISPRVWGVQVLEFFADDECLHRVSGGQAISSGTVESLRPTFMDKTSYLPANAIDGDAETVFAAQCKLGWDILNYSNVNCHDAWIGVDYGSTAFEVRCVRIMQSHLESPTCCDPAEELELQRWNGTSWVEASWRHEPPVGSDLAPRYLGSHFTHLGECPLPSELGKDTIDKAQVWEQRARRDSDNCVVPLTGATTLLGESHCINHVRCIAAVGGEGFCCPLGDAAESISRCCCKFLEGEVIFVDESEQNPYRRDFAFEFAVIQLGWYLPFAGASFAAVLYLIALTLPPGAQDAVAFWSMRPRRRCRCLQWVPRLIALLLWPMLAWRTWMHESEGIAARVCVALILPGPGRTRPQPVQIWRFPLWVGLVGWTFGAAPWILIGALLGEICLRILLLLNVVVRFCASPYDPQNKRDMILRQMASQRRIDAEDDTAEGAELFYGLMSCIVISVIYFMKFVFDVLIMRMSMANYDAIRIIDIARLVDIFPGILALFREPALLMWEVMQWASTISSDVISILMGIPLCEGSCVLVASTVLVWVLTPTCQWLNYDPFGLLAAARQTAKRTRPESQRMLCDMTVMASLSVQFGMIQCAMLLFGRALSLVNPFATRVWFCEFDDVWAVIVGRVFIAAAAIVGCIFVFLCSNGHFMGQDYLTEPMARFLRIDLRNLDPDGTGRDGGWIRMNTFLSAVPTCAGVWTDKWNIRGYLVKERAHLYADQLQDPQPCLNCGQVHVKYGPLMTATARQVSLALQVLPFGILVGKASEYFNDPPLFYKGEDLTCFRILPVAKAEKRPTLGTGNLGSKVLLVLAEVCVFMLEFGFPILRRCVAAAIFLLGLYSTFGINPDNLMDRGPQTVAIVFGLAVCKAWMETLGEVACSFTLGLISKYLSKDDSGGSGLDLTSNTVRTVVGQALLGGSAATLFCTLLVDIGTVSGMWGGILLGGFLGWLYSNIIVLVNMTMEMPPKQLEDPPSVSPFPTIAKAIIALVCGVMMVLIAAEAVNLRVAIAAGIFIAGVQLLATKMVLVDRRPRPERDDPTKRDDGMWKGSPSIIIFKTMRFLPGAVSIPTGAIAGALFAESVGTEPFERMLASVFIGFPTSAILVMAVNRFQNKTPQLIGFFVAVTVWVCVLQWNFIIATAISCVVFAVVGALLEYRIVRREESRQVKEWEEHDCTVEMRMRASGRSRSKEEALMALGLEDEQLNREQKMEKAVKRLAIGDESYPGADKMLMYGTDPEVMRRHTIDDGGPLVFMTKDKYLEVKDRGSEFDAQSDAGFGHDFFEDEEEPDFDRTLSVRGLRELANPGAEGDVLRGAIADVGGASKPALLQGRPVPQALGDLDSRPGTLALASGTRRGVSFDASDLPLAVFSPPASNRRPPPPPLVDNFRLERDDEELPLALPVDEPLPPDKLGWDEATEAPPDDTMLQRWDHGVPQAAHTKRRTRAAPVKPSAWGAVQQGPPRRVDVGSIHAGQGLRAQSGPSGHGATSPAGDIAAATAAGAAPGGRSLPRQLLRGSSEVAASSPVRPARAAYAAVHAHSTRSASVDAVSPSAAGAGAGRGVGGGGFRGAAGARGATSPAAKR